MPVFFSLNMSCNSFSAYYTVEKQVRFGLLGSKLCILCVRSYRTVILLGTRANNGNRKLNQKCNHVHPAYVPCAARQQYS